MYIYIYKDIFKIHILYPTQLQVSIIDQHVRHDSIVPRGAETQAI